jgi:hypothetical protein
VVLPGVFLGVEFQPALKTRFPDAIAGRALIAHCLESSLILDLKRYTLPGAARADRGESIIFVWLTRGSCGDSPRVTAAWTMKRQDEAAWSVRALNEIAARGTCRTD